MPVIIMNEGPGSAASPPLQTTPEGRVLLDLSHFKTPAGLIKIAQVVLGIILLSVGPPIYLRVVAWIALWGTFPWVWVYFFQINRRFELRPPWIVLEFWFTAGAFIAYGIMTLIAFLTISWISAIIGLINTLAYAFGTYTLVPEFKEYKYGTAANATMNNSPPYPNNLPK